MIHIPNFVMAVVFGLLAILAGLLTWRLNRQDNGLDFSDLITSTDRKGRVRVDARKCFELGAFLTSTAVFAFITVVDKLTEWFFVGYMTAWVGARWLRDRERRLDRPEGKK